MQKVVSIYLHSYSQAAQPDVEQKRKWYQGQYAPHGHVQEHLEEYLRDGWRVVSMTSAGGADQGIAHGWVMVVLEKPE